MSLLLLVAEFVFTEEGEAAFEHHRARTLDEVRSIEGCVQAVLWAREDRRYQFSTLWSDDAGVGRWVENEFHQSVLMPGFRSWCTEGCFGEYRLETDHPRARRCGRCGRWSQAPSGWDERSPRACRHCDAAIDPPSDV